MADLHCPNCGDAIVPAFKNVRLITCASCGTSLFLEDEAARLAGQAGVMHDVPMLFGLGDIVRLGNVMLTLHGQARFSYGRGTWDEFWGLSQDDQPFWLSLDEGDMVLQQGIDPSAAPKTATSLRPGAMLQFYGESYKVTEIDEAECLAVKGSFDEALQVGETYRFVNAQNSRSELLSGEIWQGGESWYLGRWFDPFEISVERAYA